MKTLSPALAAHLAGEVITLATCWKLTLTIGTVMGFTDHSENITVDGVTYQAATGFTPSAISSTSSLAVDNLEVEGLLDSGAITESDVLAGKYDFAEIMLFKVNYADISQGILLLRQGWLGEVSTSGNRFVAEVRGLSQRMGQTIGMLYSPSCRAKFADSACKLNPEDYAVSGTLTGVQSRQIIEDSSRAEPAGHFDYGRITFQSGANSGLAMEVKSYSPGRVILSLPMPYPLAESDSYTLIAGCDKTASTCKNRYNNILNFRGEPNLPGMDQVLTTA